MRQLKVRMVMVVCALGLLAPATAAAATINFSTLLGGGTPVATVFGVLRSYGDSLTFGGLTFTSSNNLSYGLSVWETAAPTHPVGGAPTTSLFEYAAGFEIGFARTGGGAFDLLGIDLANWGVYQSSFPASFNVTFVGTRPDTTTVTQTFTVNNTGPDGAAPILQSFLFSGFLGIASVKVTQGTYAAGTAFQFNNLVVDGLAPAAVPEPATFGLLGAGLAALGRRHWRRSRTR